MIDLIQDIYDAVGDERRWTRVTKRLAGHVSGEVARHLEAARVAHEEHVRMAREVAALSAVHDQIALGALVVDVEGTILKSNALARRLLNEASGIGVTNGHVDAADPQDAEALRGAIAETAGGRRRTVPLVVARRSDRPPVAIFVMRSDTSASPFFGDDAAALLLLVDPDVARAPGFETLKAIFGLTAREAECAGLLMRGLTIADAARELGVTRATARTFLASIAQKTDTHTQSELVGRLLAIPNLLTP